MLLFLLQASWLLIYFGNCYYDVRERKKRREMNLRYRGGCYHDSDIDSISRGTDGFSPGCYDGYYSNGGLNGGFDSGWND